MDEDRQLTNACPRCRESRSNCTCKSLALWVWRDGFGDTKCGPKEKAPACAVLYVPDEWREWGMGLSVKLNEQLIEAKQVLDALCIAVEEQKTDGKIVPRSIRVSHALRMGRKFLST